MRVEHSLGVEHCEPTQREPNTESRAARRSFCLTTFRLSCRCCTTAVPGDASPAAFVQTPRCPSQIGKSCGAVPGGRGFSFAATLAFNAARYDGRGILLREATKGTKGPQKSRSKLNAKPLAWAQFRRVMNSFTFHAEGRPGWSTLPALWAQRPAPRGRAQGQGRSRAFRYFQSRTF